MTRLTANQAQALLGQPKRSKLGNKPVWECQECDTGYSANYELKLIKFGDKKRCPLCGYMEFTRFASKREYSRWCELRRDEKAGQIRNLRRQVDFTFVVNGRQLKTPKGRPLKYRCDATGEEYMAEGKRIGSTTHFWQPFVHDAKGQRSGAAYDLFWLKAKLMAAGACPEFPQGIDIKET